MNRRELLRGGAAALIFGRSKALAAHAKGQKSAASQTDTPVKNPKAALAKSHALLVMDADTGEIVTDINGSDLWAPASLTKIMTIYLACEAIEKKLLDPNEEKSVDRIDIQSEIKLGLQAKDKISLMQAMQAMTVFSANDAAEWLGRQVAAAYAMPEKDSKGRTVTHEVNIAHLMNKKAQELGMKDTWFLNATGFPPDTNGEQYTTAHDMAVLMKALWDNYPDPFARAFGVQAITYKGVRHDKTDHGVSNDPAYAAAGIKIEAVKTGHTDFADHSIIAAASKDTPNGKRRLVTVILGAPSIEERVVELKKAFMHGFDPSQPAPVSDQPEQAQSQPTPTDSDQRVQVQGRAAPTQDRVAQTPKRTTRVQDQATPSRGLPSGVTREENGGLLGPVTDPTLQLPSRPAPPPAPPEPAYCNTFGVSCPKP